MKEILRQLDKAIEGFTGIRINMVADGNDIYAMFAPAKYEINGTVIRLQDVEGNYMSVNCEEVEYDEVSNFYICRSRETELIVEFEPC